MEGYSGPAVPFTPSPGTGELQLEPLFVGGIPVDYHLTGSSPCIDAGDPGSPLDPDSTRADMGCFYFDQTGSSILQITMTPINPPIQIPAGGGSFEFFVNVENMTCSTQTFDIWLRVWFPGVIGGILMRREASLPANRQVQRHMRQFVPASAPACTYNYFCEAGYLPNTIIAADSFTVVKMGGYGYNSTDGWTCEGWDYEPEELSCAESEFDLSISPNPFNQQSLVSFILPEVDNVKVNIYDITGREIVCLHNGILPSGRHDFNFRAENLSTGLYFARIETPGRTIIGKLLLIK
mgnify:CR=1 FL=1